MINRLFLIFQLIIVTGFAYAENPSWTIKRGDLVEKRVFYGEVKAHNKIDISAPQFGWNIAEQLIITYIPDDGTLVKKGDIILTFDDSELLSKYRNAQSEYDIAVANLEQKKSSLSLEESSLKLDIKRKNMEIEKTKLAVIEGELVSDIERKKAKLNVESRTIEYGLLKKKMGEFQEKKRNSLKVNELKVAQEKQKIEDLSDIIAKLKVKSPTDGITYRPLTQLNWARTKATRGAAVASSDLVLQLPNMNSFEVHLYVHPSDVQNFKVGDKADTTIIALPKHSFTGTIVTINSFVSTRNERLGTTNAEGNISEVSVVVSLDKQSQDLRPGMSTRTEIKSLIASNVLYIPLVAVSENDKGSYVMLTNGKRKRVEIGKTTTHFAEVIKGLQGGDRIRY